MFLGSGVGVTPLVSMYDEAIKAGTPAIFLQSTSNAENVAFEEKLNQITEQSEYATFIKHFRDSDGFIETEQLSEYVDENTEVYVCGGNSFLKAMIAELQSLNISMDHVHFETFIPRLSFSV